MIDDGSADAADVDAAAAAPPGSLRGLLASLIEALKTRLDLVVVEAEIYLLRTLQTLLWALAALACGLLAFVFVIVAIIAALWDTHRMAGVLGGAGLFAVLTAVFTALAMRAMRVRPLILDKSLQQLEHDRRKVDGTE
jgi:uncharacterized membrane protein YqjE